MFEKIGQAAEQMASNISVSRRGFLGRLGQAALAGAAFGGVLLLRGNAQAGGPNSPCGKCPPGYHCVLTYGGYGCLKQK